MKLDKISASIKPRNVWQSIDLGMLMVRTWWKPLYGSWILLTFPIFLLLNGLTVINSQLPVFVFWWLKPFFESMLLFFFSRALFGEILSVKETIRQFPSQGRVQMIHYLTYRRFSPYRSFTMPVTQLELLKDVKRKNRTSVLLQEIDSKVLGMFLALLHFEFILFFALIAVIFIFTPPEMRKSFYSSLQYFDASEFNLQQVIYNLFSYVIFSLIAPFHVGAGFSLYLNRRASLEGWDIELVFRKIALRFDQRMDTKRKLQNRLSLMLILITFLGLTGSFFYHGSALAEESVRNKPGPVIQHDHRTAKTTIENILAEEQFHVKETITSYKFLKDLFKPPTPEEETSFDLSDRLKKIIFWLARSIEVILWVCLGILLFMIGYKYRNWMRQLVGLRTKEKVINSAPETLFGLAIKEDTLPEKIPEKVLALWREGRHRQALGLLFRATLSRLVTDYQLTFHDSFTELECVRLVSRYQQGAIDQYFKTLTNQWQRVAYGHQYPKIEIMESLCSEWGQLFERTEARKPNAEDQ